MSHENATPTENQTAAVHNGTPQLTQVPKQKNKSDFGPDFVAPDGGWGWIVCIAAGLSLFSIYPASQQYFILYYSRMRKFRMGDKQINSIILMRLAPSILIGVINGAIFRRFTFRQVALTGGLFVFIGIALTAFCKNPIQYWICFFLYDIGVALNTAATTFAVYTYFNIHRRIATGFVWTIIGLGPIIFPPLFMYLLEACGDQVTILITAAVTLISLVCGIALKPVLYHGRPKLPEIYNGGHINLQDRTAEEGTQEDNSLGRSNIGQQNEQIQGQAVEEIIIKRKKTFIHKVVKFFDLDLLCDLTFINLVQGRTIMSIGINSFIVMSPYILVSYGYHGKEIAWVFSSLVIMDIVTRFLAPFVLERVKVGNSTLFAFGIMITIIGRSLFTLIDSYYVVLGLFAMIGFGNAFCTVFGQLVIPTYVPLHRLPAAWGLQMAWEILIWLTFFQLLQGEITHFFGYSGAIYLINLLTMLSLALWIVEWLIRRKLGKLNSHTQQH